MGLAGSAGMGATIQGQIEGVVLQFLEFVESKFIFLAGSNWDWEIGVSCKWMRGRGLWGFFGDALKWAICEIAIRVWERTGGVFATDEHRWARIGE